MPLFGIVKTLDTRNKIVSAGEARQIAGARSARWITGSFDPLLAEHAASISSTKKSGELLIVEVANPPEPLLPQRARAELIAGLASVDYVVISEKQIPTDDVSAHFVDHVRRRAHGAKA